VAFPLIWEVELFYLSNVIRVPRKENRLFISVSDETVKGELFRILTSNSLKLISFQELFKLLNNQSNNNI
jgi:hypothetical protein